MTRSAEQRSRRAEKERERRVAESPASRQARLLQLGDAVGRKPWSPASLPSVGTLV